jgi:hypothetical protein
VRFVQTRGVGPAAASTRTLASGSIASTPVRREKTHCLFRVVFSFGKKKNWIICQDRLGTNTDQKLETKKTYLSAGDNELLKSIVDDSEGATPFNLIQFPHHENSDRLPRQAQDDDLIRKVETKNDGGMACSFLLSSGCIMIYNSNIYDI